MHYIKDLFKNKKTEHAHKKFIRYSKGNFTGPLIKIRVSKKNIRLNGSFHITNEILMLMGEALGDREISVKGNLSWNKDLSPDLEKTGIKYLKVVKSRGIFNYKLENVVKLKDMVKNLIEYYLLINFKTDDYSLTTKPKYPKPNKEISKDFCKSVFPATMTDKILSEFAWDVKEEKIKEIMIEHSIIVDDIQMPDTDDFDEIRRLAKRCGTLKRTVTVNKDEPVVTEIKFCI